MIGDLVTDTAYDADGDASEGAGHGDGLDHNWMEAAVDTLVASHADDPALRSVFRHAYSPSLRTFFEYLVERGVRRGEVSGAVLSGQLTGTAVWFPPGTFPPGGRIALSVRAAGTLARNRDASTVAMERLVRGLMRRHPKRPIWYLAAIGVTPTRQRHGIGARMLDPMLKRIDAAGEECLVHVSRESAVEFFRDLGFHVVAGPWQIAGDGPDMWTLRRSPRAKSGPVFIAPGYAPR